MNSKDKYFDYIIHGGDYNPDQWINTKEIWDEDMRLMKLAGINSATIGIFAWSKFEPEEGVFNFSWLDEIMDKCAENKIDVILATPSGARPAWLAQKYPEVLRVDENGIRNEYGVRHNHCLTSPVYREKVRIINTKLAQRYKDHPALKMWHVSNEYSGCCHCELCRDKFREWLKDYYNNDINDLNDRWWNGFWSHDLNDFSQITSPTYRGENHVSALKLAWFRFVTDNTISFYEDEIKPLREYTPDIPITTNFMSSYDGFNYQKFAKHVDLMAWDSYPQFGDGKDDLYSANSAFFHDAFRSMKGGKPFFLMESTPSIVNHHDVNKIPPVELTRLYSIQAVAHGADSIQYFQFRKSRGSHEKFHGAVVDHCGHENTRVFRGIAETGKILKKLAPVAGSRCESNVAVIFDWEVMVAYKNFSGYNTVGRNYPDVCLAWYKALCELNLGIDVISPYDDFGKYSLIIAPSLYMVADETITKIEEYVTTGGHFLATCLTAVCDTDDRVYLGGLPAGKLKDVFGIWAEETDSIPDDYPGTAEFNGNEYKTETMCDLINSVTAEVLGTYTSDFYSGSPSVTVNRYKQGSAYYCAFSNNSEFIPDFCKYITEELNIRPQVDIKADKGLTIRKRGDYIFVMNFSREEKCACLDREYKNALSGEAVSGKIMLSPYGFEVLQ